MSSTNETASLDFLHECIRKALGDSETLDDVFDVCKLSGINARHLASDFSIAKAAERLFMTESEASAVLRVCKEEITKLDSPGVYSCLATR